MYGAFSVPVSLATICGGQLEEDFQALYPAMLAQLKHGDKASITITITLERVKNTDTMINASVKVAPKWPAKARASICQLTGDGRLKTEEPPRPKTIQLFKEGTTNE